MKKELYKILGLLVIILGIAASFYTGLWIMLIQGTIMIINGFGIANVGTIILGIIRILLSPFSFAIIASGSILTGLIMILKNSTLDEIKKLADETINDDSNIAQIIIKVMNKK